VSFKVQISEEMWINDEVYQISVEKENSYVDCETLRGWHKDDTLSDINSSIDTRVGDRIQSVDVGWETGKWKA